MPTGGIYERVAMHALFENCRMCAGSSIHVHYKSVNTAKVFTDLEETSCKNVGDRVSFVYTCLYSSFRELQLYLFMQESSSLKQPDLTPKRLFWVSVVVTVLFISPVGLIAIFCSIVVCDYIL